MKISVNIGDIGAIFVRAAVKTRFENKQTDVRDKKKTTTYVTAVVPGMYQGTSTSETFW